MKRGRILVTVLVGSANSPDGPRSSLALARFAISMRCRRREVADFSEKEHPSSLPGECVTAR